MIDLLIAWYALGWVNVGLQWAACGECDEVDIFFGFIYGVLAFPVFLFRVILNISDCNPQYLWRKE